MNKSILTLLFAAAASSALASGFSLFQGDSTGIADAAGSIAKGGRVGDLYYNPATLANLPEGTTNAIQAGCFFTRPHLKIDTSNPYTGEKYHTSAENQWFQIPHVYYGHRFNDSIVAGFGLFSRIGLGDHFPDGWPGRYNSTQVEFYTFDFAPTISWRVCDWLSVGAGLTLQYFNIALEQDIDAAGAAGLRPYNNPDFSPYDVHQRIHGDDSLAVGYDLGIQVRPISRLHLGLAYHSEVTAHAKGHVRYDVPAPIKAMYPMYFQYTGVRGTITEPDYWMAAIVYDLTDRLAIGGAVTRSGWSSWDALRIRLDTAFLPGHDTLYSEKNWDDVWRWSAGAAYRINDEWTVRGSFTWDDSPIDPDHADYIVPADTRQIYALGLSWERGPWALDGAYFFEHIDDMDVPARPAEGISEGKYTDGFSHAFSFTVGYSF
ncbi:MAG: outer membrane protein transport protein [Kiritimatiellae bacterium]|nr:outer membrane protein transport protein [Kiritimatiellia bacterium]